MSYKDQAILYLLELTTTSRRLREIIGPSLMDKSEDYREEAFQNLIDRHVRLYDKYYTLNDINNMIVFYSTPTGNRTAELTVIFLNDSQSMIQEWADEFVVLNPDKNVADDCDFGESFLDDISPSTN